MSSHRVTTIIGSIVIIVIAAVAIYGNYQQAKPELPISVSFRPAILGQGLVAQFRNNSGAALEVELTLNRPATNTYQREVLELPAGLTEIGPLQNWTFVPGQQVKLANVSFRPLEFTVPGGADGQLRGACPVITRQFCPNQSGSALRTCIEQNRSKYANLSSACTRLLDGG
jgi:hypothetical protein